MNVCVYVGGGGGGGEGGQSIFKSQGRYLGFKEDFAMPPQIFGKSLEQ